MKNAEGFKFMKSDEVDKRSRQNYVNSSAPHKTWTNNNTSSNDSYRKKSNQFGNGNTNQNGNPVGNNSNANDKPFSHLGANYQADDNQRVYRVKAPSHI